MKYKNNIGMPLENLILIALADIHPALRNYHPAKSTSTLPPKKWRKKSNRANTTSWVMKTLPDPQLSFFKIPL